MILLFKFILQNTFKNILKQTPEWRNEWIKYLQPEMQRETTNHGESEMIATRYVCLPIKNNVLYWNDNRSNMNQVKYFQG